MAARIGQTGSQHQRIVVGRPRPSDDLLEQRDERTHCGRRHDDESHQPNPAADCQPHRQRCEDDEPEDAETGGREHLEEVDEGTAAVAIGHGQADRNVKGEQRLPAPRHENAEHRDDADKQQRAEESTYHRTRHNQILPGVDHAHGNPVAG